MKRFTAFALCTAAIAGAAVAIAIMKRRQDEACCRYDSDEMDDDEFFCEDCGTCGVCDDDNADVEAPTDADEAAEAVKDAAEDVADAVSDAVEDVKDAAADVIDEAKDALDEVADAHESSYKKKK